MDCSLPKMNGLYTPELSQLSEFVYNILPMVERGKQIWRIRLDDIWKAVHNFFVLVSFLV